MQSSRFSLPLTIIHWILFVEAIYCFGFVGLAYGLGEGFPAALDIVIRVLSFKKGWQRPPLYTSTLLLSQRSLPPNSD